MCDRTITVAGPSTLFLLPSAETHPLDAKIPLIEADAPFLLKDSKATKLLLARIFLLNAVNF